MSRRSIHVLYAWSDADETLCVSRVLATNQICVFRLPSGLATQAHAGKVYRVQDGKQNPKLFQRNFQDWCLTPWTSLQPVPVKPSKPLPKDIRPLTRKLGARVVRLDRANRYICVDHQSTEYLVQLDRVPSFLDNNMLVNLECVLAVGGGFNRRLRCNGCNVQVIQRKRNRAAPDTPRLMRVVSPVFCLMQTLVQLSLEENGRFQVCSNAPGLQRFCNMNVRPRLLSRAVRAPPIDDLIQHVPMYKNKAKNAKFWNEAAPFLFCRPPKSDRRSESKQKSVRATSPAGLHYRSVRDPKLRLLLCRATYGGNKFYARQFIQHYKRYMQQQQHNGLSRSRNDNRLPPPPPEFVCPIVYAWMERNGGVADALSRLCKFDSLSAHIDHLVREGFLKWTRKQLMDYLETVMTSVLVPLFGDKGARRGIRNSFTRITLALTLSESGVGDDTVCNFVGQCIPIGDTYVQHIRRVLRGVDMKSIRRVAHLKIPKWVNVAYRKAPDGADGLGEGACLRPVEASATTRAVLWGGKQLRPHKDTIVKEELVNIHKCEQARRDLQQCVETERAKGKRADWTRIEQLKRYLKFLTTSLKFTERINDTMGRRTVKYRKRGAIGRFIPSWPSFTMSPSNLRRFSCTEHTDVDIKNCHPTLLSQIIARSPDHRHYDMLGQYVLHREKVLADLSEYYGGCSRGLVKDLVLRLINGGGINNWAYEIEDPVVKKQVEKVRAAKGEHEYVERLARELKHVRAMLVRLYYGAGADVADVKLFSMCLQQLECVCIMAVTEFFERTLRMTVDTLVYDGIIVRSKNIRPEHLRACEAHVLDQTSFKIQLVTKPFPIVEF